MVSLSTNIAVDAQGNQSLQPSLTGYVDAPAAGRWVLFVNDINPAILSGDLSDAYTGRLRYNAVDVRAKGLPSGKVAAGTPVTATLTIKNTGKAPLTCSPTPG